jgi:chemotaxis protein methyltransferase CheR
MNITDSEFEYFRDIVYKESGINLTPNKKCLVQTRVGKLAKKINFSSYEELFSLLKEDKQGVLLVHLLDSISTNHTFFFRENDHFKYLNEKILPEFKANQIKPKIWSAASSSGEEPYTLAITLQEFFGKPDYSMLCSDISSRMLKQAQNGVYAENSVKDISLELKRKYFQKGTGLSDGLVKTKDVLRQNMSFKRHNLLEPLSDNVKFDIIFCRNVMIYFDNKTKQKVIDLLSPKLSNGGYLIIGHSESLNATNHMLKMVKPTIYKAS